MSLGVRCRVTVKSAIFSVSSHGVFERVLGHVTEVNAIRLTLDSLFGSDAEELASDDSYSLNILFGRGRTDRRTGAGTRTRLLRRDSVRWAQTNNGTIKLSEAESDKYSSGRI